MKRGRSRGRSLSEGRGPGHLNLGRAQSLRSSLGDDRPPAYLSRGRAPTLQHTHSGVPPASFTRGRALLPLPFIFGDNRGALAYPNRGSAPLVRANVSNDVPPPPVYPSRGGAMGLGSNFSNDGVSAQPNRRPSRPQRSNEDCYFYYYSSCQNGDNCSYRHEPAARGNEVVCKYWQKDSCTKPQCPFRHMTLKVNRATIPCYHEQKPGGCQKEFCPFLHSTKNGQKEEETPDALSHWVFVFMEMEKGMTKLNTMDLPLSALLLANYDLLTSPLPAIQPSICQAFLEGCCVDVMCPMYHNTKPYLWQVSADGTTWFSLPKADNYSLENEYCNVYRSIMELPSQDLEEGHPLKFLLKDCLWKIDFEVLELTDTVMKTNTLKLRRLTVASSGNTEITLWKWYCFVGEVWIEYSNHECQALERAFQENPMQVVKLQSLNCHVDLAEKVHKDQKKICLVRRRPLKAAVKWYWRDENLQWILYGEVNSKGHKAIIDSQAIERKYQEDPNGKFRFRASNQFIYSLDFKKMKQKNTRTKRCRAVRREEENIFQERLTLGSSSGVPKHWEDMNNNIYITIMLNEFSNEYINATKNFVEMLPAKCKIVSVERVQNLGLWLNYQTKKQMMLKLNGNDMDKVNEQVLFHGTSLRIVDKICTENFDWRLAGTHVGARFGKGVYFTNNIQYCLQYCDASDDPKVIFVSRVLVGNITKGHLTMRRPPDNPVTGHQYDTTVNDLFTPLIFVKYYDNTFYPDYIVKLSVV